MTFFGKSKGKHSRGKRQQDKPLNDVPQSLDYHISDKDKLIYYSEGKMKSCEDMYGVKTTKKKFSATVSATTSAEGLSAGLSPSFEDSPKGKRKILSDIGKELQDRKELYFEPDLVREKFALIRVIAKCGTMWPWAGNDEEFQRVVWWVGKLLAVSPFLRMEVWKTISKTLPRKTTQERRLGGHRVLRNILTLLRQ